MRRTAHLLDLIGFFGTSAGDQETAPTFVTSATLPSATVGDTTPTSIVASGADSYSVTAGALPAGRSLNSTTGEITGTFETEESATFTITAENAYGTASREFTQTVDALTISDDFSGTLTDWLGATESVIQGGSLRVIPTKSSTNLMLDPSFENGSARTTPTDWTGFGGALTRVNDPASGGGRRAGDVSASAAGQIGFYQNVSGIESHRWYHVEDYQRRQGASATAHFLKVDSPAGVVRNQSTFNSDATYTRYAMTALTRGAELRVTTECTSSAAGGRLRGDLYAVQRITQPFLYRAVPSGRIYIEAQVTMPSDQNRVMVAHIIDADHFVAAVIEDRATVYLLAVGGSADDIFGATGITYSAGAPLRLIFNPDTLRYSVNYNGVEVIGVTDVGDADMVNADKAGLFASGEDTDGGVARTPLLDNFVAVRY